MYPKLLTRTSANHGVGTVGTRGTEVFVNVRHKFLKFTQFSKFSGEKIYDLDPLQ